MKTHLDTGIFWFRHDQRLNDNLALVRLCMEVEQLIPVFVIDPRWFEPQRHNCRHMGQHRWSFIVQSLSELNSQLVTLNSQLFICEGPPEIEISKLVQKHQARVLGISRAPGYYEKKQLQTIQLSCPQLEVISEESSTLFREEQFPFSLQELPEHFTLFRKKVEELDIDPVAKAPEWLPSFPQELTQSENPAKQLLKYGNKADLIKTDIQGGNIAGHSRLHDYTFTSENILTYKETRNGLLDFDDSSKLSPWLANGNLSAKEVYWKIKRFEQNRKANESTYWLYFELLWREYFQWYLHKHQRHCFRFSGIKSTGIKGTGKKWASPLTSFWPERFEKWRTGNTPWPIVNACMRQLNATGYMSNRGRQIVASCLVHELNLDWRYGAAWFEEQLIDFDVASNWGNWQYLAGVGADPRGHRKFDLEKQTRQYDPHNEFIAHWISADESIALSHEPLDSTDMVDWPVG